MEQKQKQSTSDFAVSDGSKSTQTKVIGHHASEKHDTVSTFVLSTKELNTECLQSLTCKSVIFTNITISLICKSFVGSHPLPPQMTEEETIFFRSFHPHILRSISGRSDYSLREG